MINVLYSVYFKQIKTKTTKIAKAYTHSVLRVCVKQNNGDGKESVCAREDGMLKIT